MKCHSHWNLHLLHNINKKETAKDTALPGRDHDPLYANPGLGLTLGML